MYVCDGGEWEGDLEEECVEGGEGGGGLGVVQEADVVQPSRRKEDVHI